MYVPSSFEIEDKERVDAFLQRYAFATLVSSPPSGIVATHLPAVVRRTASGPVLVGHVARANPHWESMDGATEALAIFLGPHAYVSPTWYATGPAVPTWNYGTVHVYGRPRANADAAFTRDLLDELVLRYERGPGAWRFEEQPPRFSEQLLSAIVAFEMPVDKLEAKFKLGQNRSLEDRRGTVAGLERSASPEAAALAAFTRSNTDDL
jgi:transcriptional regulator